VTEKKSHFLTRPSASAGVLLCVLALDQLTKMLALNLLGDTVFMGHLRSDHARKVVGDFLWLFVAYNPGSAFSMAPQSLVPFLPPTVFFSLLTAVAGIFLVRFWLRHPEPIVRLGSALVLAGALGNLTDRLRITYVVDFISVGVPGVVWRWPTFNVADSAICVGVGLLLWGERRLQPAAVPAADPSLPSGPEGTP
jgi:signal peptidase II